MRTKSGDLRICGVLDRLERVLTAENEGIDSDPAFDVRASNAQKSRCLYELTQLQRTLSSDEVSPAAARRLAEIRPLLAANEVKLKAHVEAVRAVAELLKEAIATAEADGTYSAEQFRHRA
ncbi:MAG TPA: hypothetical protein VFJ18_00220 [Pararhizobium sp.]|jgi:hypothetical protein|nr:hypothetical protein [Pararhizobium sp.]